MNALNDVFQSRGSKEKNKESIGIQTGACLLSRLYQKYMEDSHSPAIL